MGRTLKEQLIKNSSFDYWLHNGHHHGKGDLQRCIDKLPAITRTIQKGKKLKLKDEKIIYEAMSACADLKIMAEKWPERHLLMQKHLTHEEIMQAESNKSAVEALSARVDQLLIELQNAYAERSLSWAEEKESITRNVEESRRNPGRKRGVAARRNMEMLLHQLVTLSDASI